MGSTLLGSGSLRHTRCGSVVGGSGARGRGAGGADAVSADPGGAHRARGGPVAGRSLRHAGQGRAGAGGDGADPHADPRQDRPIDGGAGPHREHGVRRRMGGGSDSAPGRVARPGVEASGGPGPRLGGKGGGLELPAPEGAAETAGEGVAGRVDGREARVDVLGFDTAARPLDPGLVMVGWCGRVGSRRGWQAGSPRGGRSPAAPAPSPCRAWPRGSGCRSCGWGRRRGG